MDEQAFQNFYQTYVSQVYRYIYRKVSNREEAEDLTTHVFVKAMQQLDYARDTRSIQQWLFKVARTTITDYWRTYYRTSTASLDVLLDGGWEGPVQEEAEATDKENISMDERVQRILLALPEQYREVLTCRFLLNMSTKETAVRLGLTEANVKVLQFRALKRAADLELDVPQDAIEQNAISSERDYAR